MPATTFTSAGVNNLYSNAANWSAGVPTDLGGAVTIAANQTCIFDADLSGAGFPNGLTSLTLAANARFEASTTTAVCYLKMAGNITASAAGAVIAAGDSVTAYPSGCKFTIYMNGNYQINCNASNYLTLLLYCYQPAVTYALLSNAEGIGDTVLEINQDVSACPEWNRAGAIVNINNINKAAQSEVRSIQSTAATSVTVTAGLTAIKLAGSYVILTTRNIEIISSATAISNGIIRYGSGHMINAAIRPGSTSTDGIREAINSTIGAATVFSGNGSCTNIGTSLIISGAVFSGNTYGINAGSGHSITGAVFSGNGSGIGGGGGHSIVGATFSGNNNSINGGYGYIITNAFIYYSLYGINGANGHTITGTTISGNSSGIYFGTGARPYSCTFATNTYDVRAVTDFIAYNTTFGSGTEFYEYNTAARALPAFAESINHDNSANAYRAWTRGGIVSSDTGTVYTGRTRSYAHALESATAYCFRNYTVTIDDAGGLVVQCYVRKDALMTYLPRIWILLPGVEPFITGVPDYEAIMTNSVDTWETLTLVCPNAGTSPLTVTVRTVAQNATGTAYFDPIITPLAPATYSVFNVLQTDTTEILTRLPDATAGQAGGLFIAGVNAETTVTTAFNADIVGDITGNLSGSVGSVTGEVTANTTKIAGAAVNTALAQVGVNVVTQANIDFGALQKTSLNAATPASVTGSVGSVVSFGTLVADIVTALLTGTYQGRAWRDIWLDIWKQVVGKFVADDADDPTQIVYQSPDLSTHLTHDITDTTRDWS